MAVANTWSELDTYVTERAIEEMTQWMQSCLRLRDRDEFSAAAHARTVAEGVFMLWSRVVSNQGYVQRKDELQSLLNEDRLKRDDCATE